MAPRISLALALHNHQPVGNFGWVLSEVHDVAYRPMLDALDRHPTVRVALHYSGPLLDWLRAERPDFIDRLRALVDRGQVEIIGGGYAEPVLAALPERDRIGQLTRMADDLEATFGARPRGVWLAERVWEPDLPSSLAATGHDWTILDDAHFRAAAVPEDGLWGSYTTEDQGHLVTVFGTEQGLRYRIPFRDVDDVIAYLGAHATEDGARLGTMGDDGEKFGAWPTTWEHCWGKRDWVERFFTALEANADWLTTVTPSDWLEREAPIGRVYLPTGSYAEMGAWALPPDEATAYTKALREAQRTGAPEARWLRGASWRNFQVRYREVNDLHKQMLRASAKVDALPDGPVRRAALQHLYRGQSNDPYWHGLFGGLYVPDLRVAAAAELIAAEDAADAEAGTVVSGVEEDLDLDGRPEVSLATAGQVVTIDPDEGGGIGRWDIRAARHPLAAVLRRRPEAYHRLLGDHEATEPLDADDGSGDLADASTESIHERISAKEADLASRIHDDAHERRSGLVLLLDDRLATPTAWAEGSLQGLADLANERFVVDDLVAGAVTLSWTDDGAAPVLVRSRFEVGGGRTDPTLTQTVTLENRADGPFSARLGLEWSTMLLGGGGNPQAWWDIDGVRTGHDACREAVGVSKFAQGNDHVGVAVMTAVDPPADAWIAPIETVSNSEGGFERVYQGSGLLLSWPVVRLAPGGTVTVIVRHRLRVDLDRAAAEGLPIPG